MKFTLLIAFFLISCSLIECKKLSQDEENEIVDNYFKKFDKKQFIGKSLKDFNKRRQNILKHFYEIEEHNERFKQGLELFDQELNELSDLDDEEVVEKWTGVKISSEFEGNFNNSLPPLPKVLRQKRSAIPTNFNWATRNAVQPVQSQGACGSCYAFAAIAAIESSMCIYHGKCVKLSEQEAMECTNGCRGGWDVDVYRYAQNLKGCAYDSNYPYKSNVKNICRANGERVPKSATTMWHFLPARDPENMKKFIYDYGPVWVAYLVYNSFYSYKSGIFTGCTGSNGGGHAVLITGFGEENGVKYWIAKNSWGSHWGESGYFKILRGVNCAEIESWRVSFPWTAQ